MTWPMWVFLGLGTVFVVYVVLRLAFVYYFCGGKDSGSNYYSDSEK
jgi:hypothetical protein